MAETNFHQLYIFHMVVRLGSFSRAADALDISQPAVSIQVRELEKRFGSPLLHRTRKGPKLTDTGTAVYSYSQRIFALAEEMDSTVGDLQGLKGGRLAIGSSSTPGEYILPWVIGQFQRKYPDVEVSLSISNTQSVIDQITDHELDLGMAGAPVSIDGLSSFPYVDDEIVLIAPPDDELAGEKSVPISALEDRRFILREPGSATRRTAEACLSSHGVSIRVTMELGSNEAVKRAVGASLGLGVVSRFGATPDVAAGMIKVLDVQGWDCRRPLTVLYRRDKHLPPAQRAFLRFLQEEHPLPPA